MNRKQIDTLVLSNASRFLFYRHGSSELWCENHSSNTTPSQEAGKDVPTHPGPIRQPNTLGHNGKEKTRYLFAAFSAFPMLVPHGGEPSPFSGDPLVLLERLANCTSSNLGVFVIPDLIQQLMQAVEI